jgi:hypothetical protein
MTVGADGSLTLTLTWLARSYDGPARTRSRKLRRLSVDGAGDGVRERDMGVVGREDAERGGVRVAMPKKLRGIVSGDEDESDWGGNTCG